MRTREYNCATMSKFSKEQISALCLSIRKELGKTQADMAKELNVSLTSVRAWEKARQSPSAEYFLHLLELRATKRDVNLNGLLN